MNPQEYYDALLARFWAAFGSGASMPFDLECVAAAREKRKDEDGDGVPDTALGYYDIVWGNVEKFRSNPGQIVQAERCCNMAGRIAAASALKDGSDTISAQAFKKACLKVEKIQLRAVNAAIRNGARLSDVAILAGVCG